MQSLASHKKMYKAGKIWLAATITTVFIGAGIMLQEQGVSADMNTVPAVAQVGSNNDFSQEVKDQQGMVDYAQMHVDIAQKDVDAAQAKFNDVDKTAKAASPQKIAEIQGQVKEVQGQLEDTQSKVDTLKKQADGYKAIMKDRDKAQEEYEHADDQVSVIELDLEKATQDYHNAATSEEQNEAFIQAANLSRAFVIASKDRDAKKAIADAKAEGFEEAFLRYRVVTNELDQLEPVLKKKTYALKELKNRLNQYQNINQDRQSALSYLKEKEQELQRCKNYLLEQKNKLSKMIMSQAQNNRQEQTSVTGKSEETNAKREPKKDKTVGVKEKTSITDKNNNVNSQPKDDKVDVKLSLPDGYELANKDEQVPSTITVTENGIGTINVNVKKINTTNTGWNQQGDDWLYMQKNGYLAKGWNYLNGHWFYFDLQSGIMKTGIQSIGNSFYYLNAQHDGTYGAMKTGWQFVNGHWIGLQGSGNAYVGWQAINGHWYYFDPQTAYALTNWQDINNHWYYFDPTNAWAQTGWFKSGAGYWYFFDYANAWADTGWQKINNSWYYFDNVNANALTGWQSINSHWYYFDPTNAWARTGWQWINGHWYWFDEANAWALTGWQYYGGQWYFMDQQNAWMDTGWTTNLANGQLYYLDKNGHPLTGWQRSLDGFWYYLQPGSDAAAIGWNWINGHWYYFNPEETINGIKAKGAMFTGRHFIDNRWNRFDLNGHWLGYEN